MLPLVLRVRNRRHLIHGGGGSGGGGGGNPQQGGETGAISTVGIAGSMVNGDNNRFTGKQIFLGPGAHTSTVVASPATIASDGSASSTISITVLDNFFSAPVVGITVTLAVPASDAANVTITQPVAVTNSLGVASGSIKTTTNGAHVVTATASSIVLDQTATVTGQTASPPDSTSALTLSSSTEAVGAAVTATVQAKNGNTNITTGGAAVVFIASGGTSVVNVGGTADNGDGTYTSSISGVTAGTATTISATINTIACTNTPTLTVTGGGGSTGNIYTWTFQGATDAIASGALVSDSVQTFINNTPTPKWLRDTSIFYKGTQSVRLDLPYSPGVNAGRDFNYLDGASRSVIWFRVVYRQSSPFNNDGQFDNSEQVKFFRAHQGNFGTTLASVFIGLTTDTNCGLLCLRFDHADSGHTYFANANQPQPNLNTLEAQWNVIHGFFDFSGANTGVPANDRLAGKVYLNGVLYIDKTGNNAVTATETNQMKSYQVRGTTNAINDHASSEWVGQFDIGTNDLSGMP